MRPNILGSVLSLAMILTAGHSAQAESSGLSTSQTFGSGRIYGENSVGNKSMAWETYEVRFGKNLDPSRILPNQLFADDGTFRIDVVYYNEGHPDNNHRDGFATQMVFRKVVNNVFKVEVGLGPYYSMNTTTIQGQQYDDPRLGVLSTIAALANLDNLHPGLSLRLGLNHVTMPNGPSSDAVLMGLSQDIDSPTEKIASVDNSIWIGVAVDNFKTNRADTSSTRGFSVEAKKSIGPWAGSVQAISEGDDGKFVNRRGFAAQAWYTQNLGDKWAVSAGAGPYLAMNDRSPSQKKELNGLLSLQLERSVNKNWKLYAGFTRIATGSKSTDRDMTSFGMKRQFGR